MNRSARQLALSCGLLALGAGSLCRAEELPPEKLFSIEVDYGERQAEAGSEPASAAGGSGETRPPKIYDPSQIGPRILADLLAFGGVPMPPRVSRPSALEAPRSISGSRLFSITVASGAGETAKLPPDRWKEFATTRPFRERLGLTWPLSSENSGSRHLRADSISISSLRFAPAVDEVIDEIFFEAGADVVSEGIGQVTVQVTRQCSETADCGTATVDYHTVPMTAQSGTACTGGADFESAKGSLTWGAEDTQTFNVAICSDDLSCKVDPNESCVEKFKVVLENPDKTSIRPGGDELFIEITDDDSGPPVPEPADDEIFFEAGADVVSEGIGQVTVQVTRQCSETADCGTATVDYHTVPMTAQSGTACTGGADFESAKGSLTWGAEDTQTFNVAICPDDLSCKVDPNESCVEKFKVVLENPDKTSIRPGGDELFIEITDDDHKPEPSNSDCEVFFDSSLTVVPEDVGMARIAVSLDCENTTFAKAIIVSVSTQEKTADTTDFVGFTDKRLELTASSPTQFVDIRILNDSVHDPPDRITFRIRRHEIDESEGRATIAVERQEITAIESFSLNLKLVQPPNGVAIRRGGATAIVEIADDDPQGPATVQYRVIGKTGPFGAREGLDFEPAMGTLRWEDGKVGAMTFDVKILEDEIEEPREDAILLLENETGDVELHPVARSVLTIRDGDLDGILSFKGFPKEIERGAEPKCFSVERRRGRDAEARVTVTVAKDGAQQDTDFTSTSRFPLTLVFDKGDKEKEICITARADIERQQPKTLTLKLEDFKFSLPGDPSQVDIKIRDPEGSIRVENAKRCTEGSSCTLEITNANSFPVKLQVTVVDKANSLAKEGKDFTVPEKELECAIEGCNLKLTIIKDEKPEFAETFTVSVKPIEPRGGEGKATITIVGDEQGLEAFENSLTAKVGGEVELVARLTGPRDQQRNEKVKWTVESGPGEATEDETDVQANREARNTVKIRPDAKGGDTVKVVAKLKGNDGIKAEFSIKISEFVDSCAAVENKCANNPEMPECLAPRAQVCGQNSQYEARRRTMRQQVEIQERNIKARLGTFRKGAAQVFEVQAELELDGVRIPVEALAEMFSRGGQEEDPFDIGRLLAGKGEGGGGSGDEPKVEGGDGVNAYREPRWGLFLDGILGIGNRATRPGLGTEPGKLGFKFETGGLTAGGDYRLNEKLILGGALGYVRNDTRFSEGAGTFESRGWGLSSYLSALPTESVFLEAIVTYGWNDLDLTRIVDLGETTVKIPAQTHGNQVSLSVSGGYQSQLGRMAVGGSGGVSYLRANLDGYREADVPEFDFEAEIGGSSMESLIGRLRVDVSTTVYSILTPQLEISFLHEFADNPRIVSGSFYNLFEPFETMTDSPDRNYFNAGLGLAAVFPRGRSAFIQYDKDLLREDLNAYFVRFGLRLSLQ